MKQPREGREALGFLLGPAAGAAVLTIVAALAPGFAVSRLTFVLGILLLCVVPGTVLIGLPVYYAIRKVRTPGPWWTTAFGAAISVAPTVVFATLGVGAQGVPPQARLMVYAVMGLGAAICGGVGGLVFWRLVFKGVRNPQAT